MKDYDRLLKYYLRDTEYYFMYSCITGKPQERQIAEKKIWASGKTAIAYLDQYWMPVEEYETEWKKVQDTVFMKSDSVAAGRIFREGYNLFSFLGGLTFEEIEFGKFKNYLESVSNNYFMIVSADLGNTSEPQFRLKYPISTTWKQLMSGGFISTILFEMPHKEYYVFGDSPKWGKFVANDSEIPLNIWGIKEEHLRMFEQEFVMSVTGLVRL